MATFDKGMAFLFAQKLIALKHPISNLPNLDRMNIGQRSLGPSDKFWTFVRSYVCTYNNVGHLIIGPAKFLMFCPINGFLKVRRIILFPTSEAPELRINKMCPEYSVADSMRLKVTGVSVNYMIELGLNDVNVEPYETLHSLR